MVGDWPGNVRQLCNEVQRLVARAEDGLTISPEQLSPELRRMAAADSSGFGDANCLKRVGSDGSTANVDVGTKRSAEVNDG